MFFNMSTLQAWTLWKKCEQELLFFKRTACALRSASMREECLAGHLRVMGGQTDIASMSEHRKYARWNTRDDFLRVSLSGSGEGPLQSNPFGQIVPSLAEHPLALELPSAAMNVALKGIDFTAPEHVSAN